MHEQPLEKPYFTAPEVARICNLSLQDVLAYVIAGELESDGPAAPECCIRREDLLAFMRTHGLASDAPQRDAHGPSLVPDRQLLLKLLAAERLLDLPAEANPGAPGSILEPIEPTWVVEIRPDVPGAQVRRTLGR